MLLKCQTGQRLNAELSLSLFDPCTLSPHWEIHSSMYLFGDREQLERLTCRHLSALDSVVNWPCPAHHHRTTAYQDTEMTCNMSPGSRMGGENHHLFFHLLPPSLSLGFLISHFLVFCQLMMHNIQVLFEHVGVRCSIWGEQLTDRDMPTFLSWDLWQVNSWTVVNTKKDELCMEK